MFLEEDIGTGDITTDSLIGDEEVKARIIVKENCILAGLEEAQEIFKNFGLIYLTDVSDGNQIKAKQEILSINGSAKSILKGERLALNFLGRMSGIATTTKKILDLCRLVNPNIGIAATRKTTPGFRYYEKKAVIIGGGVPHRYGLYDSILIKDNHLKVVGSITEAIRRAKKSSFTKKIEIEVKNLEEAIEAASEGVDIIMLDNFKPMDVQDTYEVVKKLGKNIVEVSGGICDKNILDYAPYTDIISLGSLTHSVKAIDFSLEIL